MQYQNLNKEIKMFKRIKIYFIVIVSLYANSVFSITLSSAQWESLSADELNNAVSIVKQSPQYSKNLLFSSVQLKEPAENLPAVKDRKASLLMFNPKKNQVFEVIVNVSQKKLISWKQIPHVQLMMGDYDINFLTPLLEKNFDWKKALKKRGIKNPKNVYMDFYLRDASEDPALKNHRLISALAFYHGSSQYVYGRPIEGLTALVDMTTKKVTVIDTGVVLIAKQDSAYDDKSVGPLRKAPHYVQIQQKDGPSFQLNGRQLVWQNWRFNISFNPRDGIVLHNIAYFDQKKWRSILKRISLSDIVVPYADPDPQWNWRHAFDASEYGLGICATPLEKDIDVPENTLLLDIPTVDEQGNLKNLKNILGIYEQYDGFVWKHYDTAITQKNTARRGQSLVVISAITISNYDYLVSYIFRQDASIEIKVSLTGIMLAKGVDEPLHEHYGHLVSENVVAIHHQHFFNFRLDFAVDGMNNSLLEANSKTIPKSAENPAGNAFTHTKTILKKTLEARRNSNPTSDRFWIVFNPNVKNSLGMPVGYALLPANNTIPHAQPDSAIRQKAGFVNYHLWATPYNPNQMNAMGLYPVLSSKPNGLPQWAEKNSSLQNTHIVLWYTMGITHIPRPEEWPVMPKAEIAFKIVPLGFFNRNPAINLPSH